jgi:hypothetical protein
MMLDLDDEEMVKLAPSVDFSLPLILTTEQKGKLVVLVTDDNFGAEQDSLKRFIQEHGKTCKSHSPVY